MRYKISPLRGSIVASGGYSRRKLLDRMIAVLCGSAPHGKHPRHGAEAG